MGTNNSSWDILKHTEILMFLITSNDKRPVTWWLSICPRISFSVSPLIRILLQLLYLVALHVLIFDLRWWVLSYYSKNQLLYEFPPRSLVISINRHHNCNTRIILSVFCLIIWIDLRSYINTSLLGECAISDQALEALWRINFDSTIKCCKFLDWHNYTKI